MEHRLDHLIYLVYAHSGSGELVPEQRGLSLGGELSALQSGSLTRRHMLLKVDLLAAL